jgi:hypothetical protein
MEVPACAGMTVVVLNEQHYDASRMTRFKRRRSALTLV